jgi:hypothetical protein
MPTTQTGQRRDQWSNTLVIDGSPLGVWDAATGGDVTAVEKKYRPGAMAPEVSLGGVPSVTNIKLTRLVTSADWVTMRRLLQSRVGRAQCTVTRQPLDADGNPFGQPLVYTGTLLIVNPGDNDSNNIDAQTWEITISTNMSIG